MSLVKCCRPFILDSFQVKLRFYRNMIVFVNFFFVIIMSSRSLSVSNKAILENRRKYNTFIMR